MSPFNSNKGVKKQVALDGFTLSIVLILLAAIIALLFITGGYFIFSRPASSGNSNVVENDDDSTQVSGNGNYPFKQDITVNMSYDTVAAETIEGISASNAVLVDITDGVIVASKLSSGEINPASMTKVMTLIVVFENLESESALKDMVEVTEEHISNKTNDRKMSGYIGGPKYPAGKYSVETLINHLILNSDGVAALALADYIAGSEANFVQLMNEKAAELELERTTFVYCDGSYDLGHKTTCRDMAKIMAYAMKNTFCANVLTSYSYSNDGVIECYHSLLVTLLHNDTPSKKLSMKKVNVTAGKTGWTNPRSLGESGGCIVSFAQGKNGHNYILVIAGADGENYTTAINNAVTDTKTVYDNYIE